MTTDHACWLGRLQADSESYIAEIEATGGAFEEMQGQNARLLGQITTRDEANANLTSERLRVRHAQSNAFPRQPLIAGSIFARSAPAQEGMSYLNFTKHTGS